MKLLAFCLVLVSATLHAAYKIDFNGTLQSASGFEPKVSFQPEYSGYQKRKAFHLKSGQHILYDLSPVLTGKQGALRFSFKADSIPSGLLVSLVRYDSVDGLQHVSLSIKRRSLIVAVNDTHFETAPQIVSPGYWLRISLFWNETAVVPSLIINEKQLHLHPVSLPAAEDPIAKGNLQIASSHGFSWRIKDLEIGNSLPPENAENYLPLIWPAKDLPHFAGKRIPDKTAQEGTAWTTDSVLSENSLRLPAPGKYELVWSVKRIAAAPEGSVVSTVYEGETKIASEKTNAVSLSENKYDKFVVSFEVNSAKTIRYSLNSLIPIKHSILADSVILRNLHTGWQLHRQIEDTHRTMGMVKDDAEAEKGKAIDNENTLTYGPYICLGEPGKYRATWRLKLSAKIPAKTAVLLLNVFAHDGFLTHSKRGNKSYGELPLSSESFSSRDSWETKSIEFQYDGADMIEFRTFTRLFQPGDVLLDTITVERVKDN